MVGLTLALYAEERMSCIHPHFVPVSPFRILGRLLVCLLDVIFPQEEGAAEDRALR